eukprot:ANDGO_08046.mRNA.1 Poly(A) RNA polymerase gld-2
MRSLLLCQISYYAVEVTFTYLAERPDHSAVLLATLANEVGRRVANTCKVQEVTVHDFWVSQGGLAAFFCKYPCLFRVLIDQNGRTTVALHASIADDDMNKHLWNTVRTAAPSSAFITVPSTIQQCLDSLLRKAGEPELAGFSLVLIGSHACNLALRGSDVDFCVSVGQNATNQKEEPNIKKILRAVCRAVKNSKATEFEVRRSLFSAKTPVITLLHTASNTEVDITANNTICAARAIRIIDESMAHFMFRPLYVLFMNWAKRNGLADPSSTSVTPYAWSLIILHFCLVFASDGIKGDLSLMLTQFLRWFLSREDDVHILSSNTLSAEETAEAFSVQATTRPRTFPVVLDLVERTKDAVACVSVAKSDAIRKSVRLLLDELDRGNYLALEEDLQNGGARDESGGDSFTNTQEQLCTPERTCSKLEDAGKGKGKGKGKAEDGSPLTDHGEDSSPAVPLQNTQGSTAPAPVQISPELHAEPVPELPSSVRAASTMAEDWPLDSGIMQTLHFEDPSHHPSHSPLRDSGRCTDRITNRCVLFEIPDRRLEIHEMLCKYWTTMAPTLGRSGGELDRLPFDPVSILAMLEA